MRVRIKGAPFVEDKPLIDMRGARGWGLKFRVITAGVTVYVDTDARRLHSRDQALNPLSGLPYTSVDPVETWSHFADILWGACTQDCEVEVFPYLNGQAVEETSARPKATSAPVGNQTIAQRLGC